MYLKFLPTKSCFNSIPQFSALLNVHPKCSLSVTIQHYCDIVDYVPYAALFISMPCLFYKWKFVHLNPLHLFNPSLPHSPFWQPSLHSLYLRIWFLFLCFPLFLCVFSLYITTVFADFSNSLMILLHCCTVSILSDEKSVIIPIIVLLRVMCIFFSSFVQDFSFNLLIWVSVDSF